MLLHNKNTQTRTEGNDLKMINAMHEKPIHHTANIILNGEKLKTFPLSSGARQGCPLLPLLFSIVLEALASAVTQGKKWHLNWLGRTKIFIVCRQ